MTSGVDRVIASRSCIRHHHHCGTWTSTRRIINVFDLTQTLDIRLENLELLWGEQITGQRVNSTNKNTVTKFTLQRNDGISDGSIPILIGTGKKFCVMCSSDGISIKAITNLVLTHRARTTTNNDVVTTFTSNFVGALTTKQDVITGDIVTNLFTRVSLNNIDAVTSKDNVVS